MPVVNIEVPWIFGPEIPKPPTRAIIDAPWLLESAESAVPKPSTRTIMEASWSSEPAVPQSEAKNIISFRDFPAELRLKVWKFALPGPRVLKMISMTTRSKREEIRKFDILSWMQNRVYSSNALSGLGMLHACFEARKVVLEHFQLLSPPLASQGGLDLEYPLYLKSQADTIFFDTGDDLRNSRRFGLGKDVHIRRIAVGITSTRGTDALNNAVDIWDWLTGFSRLEECVLVAPTHSTYDGGREIMEEIKDLEERGGGPGAVLVDSAVLKLMTQAEFEGSQQIWGGDSKFRVHLAV